MIAEMDRKGVPTSITKAYDWGMLEWEKRGPGQ